MDFWDSFLLLLIFVPLVVVWSFALVDVFHRHDLSGPWKAFWVAAIVLVPLFGAVMYLVARPHERPSGAPEGVEDVGVREEQLRVLRELHEQGKLTDAELADEEARATSSIAYWGSASRPRP
jgi:hypothetical protein